MIQTHENETHTVRRTQDAQKLVRNHVYAQNCTKCLNKYLIEITAFLLDNFEKNLKCEKQISRELCCVILNFVGILQLY